MVDAEFKQELAKRGFSIVVPEPGSGVPWGLISIGHGVTVDRWAGGSTLAEQLAYCVKASERLAGKCDATICSSRWKAPEPKPTPKVAAKKVAKKVAKKAVKKVSKKGGK